MHSGCHEIIAKQNRGQHLDACLLQVVSTVLCIVYSKLRIGSQPDILLASDITQSAYTVASHISAASKELGSIADLLVHTNLDIKSFGVASFMKLSRIHEISLLVMPIAFAYPAAEPHSSFI